MSFRQSVSQLRPARTQKVDLVEKVQSILTEATMDRDDFFKRDNQIVFAKKAVSGEIVGKDGKKFPKISNRNKLLVAFKKIKRLPRKGSKEEKNFDELMSLITNGKSHKEIEKGANGFSGKRGGQQGKTKAPSGADWENIICHQYNKLLGNENFDPAARDEAKQFYPTYKKAGEETAKTFSKKIGKAGMIQFGGGKSKSNLSSFWISKGGSDGTPKTDMYTSTHNISLKKKGGSQLASGARGETLAMYSAALEYLGADKSGLDEIKNIQKEIEDNFIKISTEYNKTELEKMSKKDTENLSTKDQDDIRQFVTTEAFHKKLNEKIKEHLNFEKNPEFVKFLIYEAMSGSKKFSLEKAKASVCMEFNADNGKISKYIPVTVDGKNKFGDVPNISSEIAAYASKVKIYSAWKSGGSSPYSSLRISSTFQKKEETLRSLVKEIVRKDIIANAVLKEEIEQLDEFAIIGRVFDKLKDVGKNAINWVKNLITKIVNAVKNALDKIATLGKKMFEGLFKFIGMELDSSTKITYPSDISGFVFGMSD